MHAKLDALQPGCAAELPLNVQEMFNSCLKQKLSLADLDFSLLCSFCEMNDCNLAICDRCSITHRLPIHLGVLRACYHEMTVSITSNACPTQDISAAQVAMGCLIISDNVSKLRNKGVHTQTHFEIHP